MEKRWWARVPGAQGGYGSWVPTGESDLEEAKWYLKTYHRVGKPMEWLLL